MSLSYNEIITLLPEGGFSTMTTLMEEVDKTVTFSSVPEPSTLLLFGSSLAGLVGVAWRRQRRKIGARGERQQRASSLAEAGAVIEH